MALICQQLLRANALHEDGCSCAVVFRDHSSVCIDSIHIIGGKLAMSAHGCGYYCTVT
jgi:hypothetical protein